MTKTGYNRAMHISGAFQTPGKANIESRKVNIENQKANIDSIKVNIEGEIHAEKVNMEDRFTPRTAAHVQKLLAVFGTNTVFGRSDVQLVLGLKSTRSSALLGEMLKQGIIEPVAGHGKGKFRFL